jgi:hypothetical protein
VAEEGIDEVLQLKEGTGEVRHSPKGGGEMAVQRRRGGLVGRARPQGRGERGGSVRGCSGALAREDERGKKGGSGAGVPFIGNAVGVGDGPWVVPHSGKAWGAGG